MFPRLTVNSCRAAGKALVPLARGVASHTRRQASGVSAASAPMPVAAPSPVSASAAAAHGITAEHAGILAMLEETAQLGHVPADALIGRLHACHCDRLEQDRQKLVVLEQELEVHLARLDARFPAPPPPEPEKPQPPRGRRFGSIGRDLRRSAVLAETRQ